MRVLLDGYWWAHGPAANRTVQRELILAWAREHPQDRLVVALRRGADPEGLPPGAGVVRTRLWPHGVSNALELRPRGADLVVAHNYAPPTGRGVVFVHDAMFVDHPEWFSRAERAYFAGMLPSARRAALIATSTRTEAARIERVAPRLAPVVATGLGPPPAIVGAAPRMPALAEGLEGFALAVGRLNVRKNLGAAIAAAGASARIGPATPLVLVGSGAHSGVPADLDAALASLPDRRAVVLAGRLDDDELAWLYRHAGVLLSLSLDEGFGMTPLEGLALGAPLLVSDIAVHRETMGAAAHRVAPDASPAELGAALDAAWGDPGDPAARADALARYDWGSVVRTLREAAQNARMRVM